MKDTLLLFLVVMGLFPILILDKLTQNKLPESSIYTLCPLISVLLAGGIGLWVGGWIYAVVGLLGWFAVSIITYMAMFSKKV